MHDIKRKKLFAMLFMVLCFCILFCNLIYAQQTEKDVSASIILPSLVNSSNYTKFVRITNNNDIPGVNDNLSVLVRLTMFTEGKTDVSEWNVSKIINSYSESGMGTLIIEENNSYTLCVELTGLNFEDSNPGNNFICANISSIIVSYEENNNPDVLELNNSNLNTSDLNNSNLSNSNITSINESEAWESNYSEEINTSANNSAEYNYSEINESVQTENNTNSENKTNNEENNEESNSNFNNTDRCSCSLRISANKEIFTEGEKIEFQIFDCGNNSKYVYPIEYWVEDKDKIVKQIINTTSKTIKSYTPSIDYGEKYFLIKSRIQGCENSTHKLVVFVNAQEQSELSEEQRETFIRISETSHNLKDKLVYARIEGYKGDSAKTLVSVWIEEEGRKISDITKFYVNEKNSFFDLKIPVLIDTEKSGKYSVVAEGLGERIEKKIYLDFPGEETGNEKEGEEPKEEWENDTVKGKIVSFYTRKKYFEENLSVYISVDSPEGKILHLYGQNSTLILENISEKNVVNLSINSPNETIRAMLYFQKELLDVAELSLNLTANSDKKFDETEKMVEKSNQTKFEDELFLRSSQILASNSTSEENKTNKITGQIISVQPTGKNIFFAVAAVAICFLFFYKKTRTFLFKKRIKNKIV